jgi:hypothetical protein
MLLTGYEHARQQLCILNKQSLCAHLQVVHENRIKYSLLHPINIFSLTVTEVISMLVDRQSY